VTLRLSLKRLRSDERAATAIEYGLICGIIAVAIIGISATGGSLTGVYQTLTEIVSALGGSEEPPPDG
jgi:pilus assembly protein Flp/PilA